tara:strand:+ start:1308 stop:1658 length:351 start_codon:yes stop_codon:yes gene_type:complete
MKFLNLGVAVALAGCGDNPRYVSSGWVPEVGGIYECVPQNDGSSLSNNNSFLFDTESLRAIPGLGNYSVEDLAVPGREDTINIMSSRRSNVFYATRKSVRGVDLGYKCTCVDTTGT